MVTGSSQTVRQQLTDLLRDLGMTTIFGNPGSTELPMFRDFPADFNYVLGLQEAVVVGMADGYAQASGKAACVNLHSAAGVGNAMGAIFTAMRNRTPLVIIAGQQARRLLPYDPFLGSTRAAELPQPHIKWSCEPARAEDVGAAIQRAWLVATQQPCGPVLVSVPVDDWERPAAPLPSRSSLGGPDAPGASAMAAIGAALDAARDPAIVAGPELDSPEGWSLLVELAERYAANVWSPPMYSRCSFPEDHPRFAGHLVAKPEVLRGQLAGHDLVLVFGAPAFTYHIDGEPPFGVEGKVMHVSLDGEFGAAASQGDFALGDCCGAIRALLARPAPPPRSLAPARAAASTPDPAPGLTAARVIAALEKLRRPDSIIVEEAPSTRPVIQAWMRVRRPQGYYAVASGGLGYGLSAAVGVAMASPQDQVIAVIGDGSAMYAIPALWSAVNQATRLKVLILANGGYAALDRFAREFQMAPVGTRLDGLDFVKLAEGQGMAASRVADEDGLEAALAAWLAADGPALLEAVVEAP